MQDGKAIPQDEATQQQDDDFGLGVAQIVITAATPMIEEAETPFPPPEDVPITNHDGVEDEETKETPESEGGTRLETMEESDEPMDEQPGDGAQFVVSSSTGNLTQSTHKHQNRNNNFIRLKEATVKPPVRVRRKIRCHTRPPPTNRRNLNRNKWWAEGRPSRTNWNPINWLVFRT